MAFTRIDKRILFMRYNLIKQTPKVFRGVPKLQDIACRCEPRAKQSPADEKIALSGYALLATT
jgi:hypothetical protein